MQHPFQSSFYKWTSRISTFSVTLLRGQIHRHLPLSRTADHQSRHTTKLHTTSPVYLHNFHKTSRNLRRPVLIARRHMEPRTIYSTLSSGHDGPTFCLSLNHEAGHGMSLVLSHVVPYPVTSSPSPVSR